MYVSIGTRSQPKISAVCSAFSRYPELCFRDSDLLQFVIFPADKRGTAQGSSVDQVSKVSCNLQLYEAYARGYLEACGDILTPEELALLPYASLIITVEDGIRFLMDHINGDTYYKIKSPLHNLERTHAQYALLQSIEAQYDAMCEVIKTTTAKYLA